SAPAPCPSPKATASAISRCRLIRFRKGLDNRRHPRESGDPSVTQVFETQKHWIPAFAGMTIQIELIRGSLGTPRAVGSPAATPPGDGPPRLRETRAMPVPRLLIALAAVLLLSACATAVTARDPGAVVVDAPAQPAALPHDPRLHAAPPQATALPSPVVVPLDAGTLAALPRVPVAATTHDQTLRCEGVALAALMQATGAMPAGPLRGAQLGRYVQVDARDGYRAV